MKPLVTLKTSVSEEVQAKLNSQISMEARSSFYYLSAASWCEKEGYENSARYMYRHAEEEKDHMLKIMHYLNEAGGHALAPEVVGLRHEYSSLREIFEQALEHEIAVSLSINELADFCFKSKDFATFQFLQWFVMEQREEEVYSRRSVELFDIIGENGQGIWLIDQEIGKLDKAAHAKSPKGEEGGKEGK